MNSKLWIRKALSLCLCVAILATSSMVALAGPKKVAGELTVSGNGDAPFVLVNGDTARSGRSIFSDSTITTSESTGAVINLGKLGRVQLAPSTALTLTFDDAGVSGNLTSGVVSVFGTAGNVAIKTLDGNTVNLAAGQSVAASGKVQQDDDDDDDGGGAAWWIWAGVFGGAAAGLLWAALSDNDIEVGDNSTVISPTR